LTEDVPRPQKQYVHHEKTRHKTDVYYFRKGKGPRIRLPEPSDPSFDDRYHAALIGLLETGKRRRTAASGSLEWLIQRYRETGVYQSLSKATRKHRDAIFRGVIDKAGTLPFAALTRAKIVEGREKRAATPHQARHFLDAMRALFAWAVEVEHVAVDPTAGVSNLPRPRNTVGFQVWTDADIAAYEACWAAGTRERVWLHVLLYTGLRRGDAVRLGRQHVRDGVATLRTEKTGVEVYIPIRQELAETLRQGPTGDLTFIVGLTGRPLTKESFGNMFRVACGAAGVDKSAHGLRKIDATRHAESGATVAELDARFGWTGGKTSSHYTRSADRKRLALSAAKKIVNAEVPHPAGEVPHPENPVVKSAG